MSNGQTIIDETPFVLEPSPMAQGPLQSSDTCPAEDGHRLCRNDCDMCNRKND